ncbi:MAG: RimK/LysX family protein [Candidatus Woesearchaeota archaeon]
MAAKTIIGLKETVVVFGKNKARKAVARIDTGASKCSIDSGLAKSLGLGPVLREKRVKSAHGIATRGIILARITIAGRTFRVFFTIADRKHMKYPVLIGRNILKRGFLIDPARKLR